MPKYKRNHFVPKGLIRRFSRDGKVSLYDTATFEKSVRTNPKSIYAVDHLYSRWSNEGSRDFSTEMLLKEDHEDRLGAVIDKLVDCDLSEWGKLDDHERTFCYRLVIRLLLRNPVFISAVQSTNWRVKLARAIFALRIGISSQAKASIRRSKLTVWEAASAELRASAATIDLDDQVRQVMSTHSLCLYRPMPAAKSFVLGNQPCLLKRKNWTVDEHGNDSSEIGPLEFYAIVDPRLMIVLVPKGSSVDEYELDDRDLDRINGLVVKYSDEVVVRSLSDLDGAWYKLFKGEEKLREWKGFSNSVESVVVRVENT
ncbi:DUF4238 domain-containing protein [Jannaschia sp.]|nr:DUF4238 domain-containing protein [Jannaschia sp.]